MSWVLLKNSFALALFTTVIAAALGYVAALTAACSKKWLRWGLVIAAVTVFALPPFLVTNTWLNYFGLTGSWRSIVDFDIYSFGGTLLILVLQLWPIAFLLTLGRLQQLDLVYFEQEPLLRGSALHLYLIWPTAKQAVGQSAVIIFILALNNFAVPALLQTKVYAAEVWLSFNTRFDFAEAFRISWPLILLAFVAIVYFRSRTVRLRFGGREASAEILRERLGMRAGLAVVTFALLAVSLALPLVQLTSSERTWTEFLPAFAAGKQGVLNSFWFAGGAAVLVGFLGAVTMKQKGWMAAWFLTLVPGVVVGISLILIFNRPWLSAFYQSTGIVLAAYVLRFFAIGWAGTRQAFLSSDARLIDLSRVLGATAWQRFRMAEWPQIRWAVLGSAYLVYLLCLWDAEILIFIVPPGRETLALRIFNMLHYGHAAQVDALCVWLLLIAITPLLLWVGWRAIRLKMNLAASTAVAVFVLTGCGGGIEKGTAVQSEIFSSVQVIGSRGTGPGQFNKPRSLAVDSSDNLYVVDLTGRVQKFSPEGKFLLTWQMPQTDKGKPKGMLQDSDGNVIVIEPHYSRVNHFRPDGKLAHQWGIHGTNRGELQFPRSVAVNSKGEIYLSEYGIVERVQRFGRNGTTFLNSFGKPGTDQGEFNRPEGLGVSPHDEIYVADSCNHRVQVFGRDGKFLTAFGTAGDGTGEMSYPYDVRIDAEGTVFVCEFGNSRIQVFSPEHQSMEMIGGAGLEAGQFHNPWSIALDSTGNLYVADSGNHRVQKYIRKKALARSKPMEISLAK